MKFYVVHRTYLVRAASPEEALGRSAIGEDPVEEWAEPVRGRDTLDTYGLEYTCPGSEGRPVSDFLAEVEGAPPTSGVRPCLFSVRVCHFCGDVQEDEATHCPSCGSPEIGWSP